MPRWVLDCPECQATFTHSEIKVPDGLTGARRNWFGDKPVFPETGSRVECPNCKKSSVYQRHQLVYRDD